MTVVDAVGPRERKYLASKAFRAASEKDRITPTHWHIALSNGLGWTFDGMDAAILGLVTPMLLKEYGLSLLDFTTALQFFGLAAVAGCIIWPWLADRFGRRTLLSFNIAVFSLAMPAAAAAPSWVFFIIFYGIVRFALAGEWAVGAPLVAETWPAKYRGIVLAANRSGYSLGKAFAGILTAYIAAEYGWRAAFYVPGLVAILAIYVRFFVPESPEWVRSQDRKERIKNDLLANRPLSNADQDWWEKAKKPRLTQLFLPDTWRATFLVTLVYTLVLMSYTTITQFMPLYLSETHHWTTQQYGLFLTVCGLIGIPAYWVSGALSDSIGRRPSFAICAIWASTFIAIWAVTNDFTWVWIIGLVWTVGYAGVYGPLASFITELYPTRVRATGTGFTLAVATLVAYTLYPYVLVNLRQWTGSFSACFLMSAAALLVVTGIVWFFCPESARKELNAIIE